MRNHAKTSLVIGSSLVLALALPVSSRVQARPAAPAAGMQMTEAQMKDQCEDMMEQKKKMAADMKAQDAELTEHVAKMNRAPEDKKLDVLAAVVTHMLEQRIAKDARKAKMEDAMMAHMMQHMQMGKDSMAQCPMMKDMNDKKGMAAMPGMKNTDDKSASAH
jgi:hypothetical protein